MIITGLGRPPSNVREVYVLRTRAFVKSKALRRKLFTSSTRARDSCYSKTARSELEWGPKMQVARKLVCEKIIELEIDLADDVREVFNPSYVVEVVHVDDQQLAVVI